MAEGAAEVAAPVQVLSMAELLPVLCAHFAVRVEGRQIVVGFAPGPESVIADDAAPAVVVPSLTVCVTHVGIR